MQSFFHSKRTGTRNRLRARHARAVHWPRVHPVELAIALPAGPGTPLRLAQVDQAGVGDVCVVEGTSKQVQLVPLKAAGLSGAARICACCIAANAPSHGRWRGWASTLQPPHSRCLSHCMHVDPGAPFPHRWMGHGSGVNGQATPVTAHGKSGCEEELDCSDVSVAAAVQSSGGAGGARPLACSVKLPCCLQAPSERVAVPSPMAWPPVPAGCVSSEAAVG